MKKQYNLSKKIKNQIAMTLIEVSITLGIVGITSASAVVGYQHYVENQQIALVKSKLNQLSQSYDKFLLEGMSMTDINNLSINDFDVSFYDDGLNEKYTFLYYPVGYFVCPETGLSISRYGDILPYNIETSSGGTLISSAENNVKKLSPADVTNLTNIKNKSWGRVENGNPALGGWYDANSTKLEFWNNTGYQGNDRDAVIELDLDGSGLVSEISRVIDVTGVESFNFTFDYMSRTANIWNKSNSSSAFEVWFDGVKVFPTVDNPLDFDNPDFQTISIDIPNTGDGEKIINFKETGASDGYGVLIDLKSIEITPIKTRIVF